MKVLLLLAIVLLAVVVVRAVRNGRGPGGRTDSKGVVDAAVVGRQGGQGFGQGGVGGGA